MIYRCLFAAASTSLLFIENNCIVIVVYRSTAVSVDTLLRKRFLL